MDKYIDAYRELIMSYFRQQNLQISTQKSSFIWFGVIQDL